MNVKDIAGGHSVACWWCFGFDFRLHRVLDFLNRLLAETAQGELRFLRVAVVQNGSKTSSTC